MKVLFLCTENSARSLLAEALLSHHSAENIDVYSAGTQPSCPSKKALQTLENFNIDSTRLSSKSIDSLSGHDFDLVITLCEHAASECQQLSDGVNYLHWPITDPKIDDTETSFAHAFNTINGKVHTLLTQLHDYKKIALTPTQFFKCLTDDIRLQSILLILLEQELCVCELMTALDEDSQPKVSRHLAQLKKKGILVDRKHQQWVFYRINATLPKWMKETLHTTLVNEPNYIQDAIGRLKNMRDRPSRKPSC